MEAPDFKADALRLSAHAALMRDLTHTPGWQCFVGYVHRMLDDARERAIHRGAGDFEKGVVAGIRDCLRIPETIMWSEQARRN